MHHLGSFLLVALALLAHGCASGFQVEARSVPREDAGSPTPAMVERHLGTPDSVQLTDYREFWGYDAQRVQGRDIPFFHYVGYGHLPDEPERRQIVVFIRRDDAKREEAFLEASRLRKPITLDMVKGLRDRMTQPEIAALFGASVRVWRDKRYEWWAYDTYNAEFTHYVSFVLGFSQEKLVFRPVVPATIYNERIQLAPGSTGTAARPPAAAPGARIGPEGSIILAPASGGESRSETPKSSL